MRFLLRWYTKIINNNTDTFYHISFGLFSTGVPSYLESDERCTEPASYFVPFFKAKMGPKYEDFSTNFHEARPGHHLQVLKIHMQINTEWGRRLLSYFVSLWYVYRLSKLALKEVALIFSRTKKVVLIKYKGLRRQESGIYQIAPSSLWFASEMFNLT